VNILHLPSYPYNAWPVSKLNFFVILILLISVLILFANLVINRLCLFFLAEASINPTKTTDEIKGSIIAPSLVTAIAYVFKIFSHLYYFYKSYNKHFSLFFKLIQCFFGKVRQY
jgi:hypothetical protein